MMGGARQQLALDKLKVNPGVARRLPFSLACRYRALPVAEDDGCVTVAMADPGDSEARQAILAALGTSACLVGSDPLLIDGLLAEVWPAEACHSLRLTVYPPAGPVGDALEAYARAIGELLKASVTRAEPAVSGDQQAGPACDLAILPALPRSGVPGRGPRAVLLAATAHPRWPLKNVLLVMNQVPLPTGDTSLAWAARLARPSQAAVTLLVVVPPVARPGIANGLGAWLTDDTAAGHQVRRAAALLVDAGLQARLRLRQGSCQHEIGRETMGDQVDLAILAGTWSARDVEPLLRQASCPLLLTGPAAPEARWGETND